ncbi:MAG TPA: ATP phosphoribosyltransferase [Candidatus Ornithospirochaeta avicola]|uniref:ATP phosphoribosyltransferase n=1 Tax=Candidatus Ornithospirochaeta avicola TaxID=2840896 RepID=A0A9D1TMS4_9SPIO|nr:ATP phosphoribosyltransferase [Candidatus Ornithospirochaeta avicola]
MERISIALQKSGRLSEKSLDMIRKCGIDFYADDRVLKAEARNFPLSFLFVRDDDIPRYVSEGIVDIGIVGKNELDESGYELEVVRDLGFASCRLSIASPVDFPYEGIKSLEGKTIATSYPRILKKILAENEVNAKIEVLQGSVEIAPSIKVSDAICDLVSTGVTLKMNGLKEDESIYRSSAVLVSKKGFEDPALTRLLSRLDAVMLARKKKYVLFNLPKDKIEEAALIIGGMKSPTVTPLFNPQWVSVQAVVSEDDFWSVFESLRTLGAEGIIVLDIEKMTE